MCHEMTEEQAAFLEYIANQYQKMLEYYCARCIGYNRNLMPLVSDLVQETYLKAVENVEVLRNHQNIPGWLKKSLHYSLLNTLRDIRTTREVLSPAIDKLRMMDRAHGENTDIWDDRITVKEVLIAVETILTEDEQIIFNDYFLDDLSTIETADRNRLSCSTVRGKISRIRKKLKKYFFEREGKSI